MGTAELQRSDSDRRGRNTGWREAVVQRSDRSGGAAQPLRSSVGESPGVVVPQSEESCAARGIVVEGEALGLRVLACRGIRMGPTFEDGSRALCETLRHLLNNRQG